MYYILLYSLLHNFRVFFFFDSLHFLTIILKDFKFVAFVVYLLLN